MALFRFTKKCSAALRGEASLLYEILTDYDSYFEWMPLVSESKLLAKEGDLAIAEFGFSNPFKEKVAVECIHTKNKMVLIRPISGRLPVTQFEWTIEPAAEGHASVTLQIEGKVNWSRFLPGFRPILNAAGCLKSLDSQLAAFSSEFVLEDKDGQRVLELMETEQGLVCWFRGKKYLMKPEGN